MNWSPIYPALHDRIANKDSLITVIAPFFQLDALKYLVDNNIFTDNLKIITRWNSHDIISGVSDIYIYPFLKKNNVPLYINNNIHLKLYIFESNYAFHTSGNVTRKGLGLAENNNIEIGGFVLANEYDWSQIFEIIDNSICVNDEIFEEAVEYYQENKEKRIELPIFDIVNKNRKLYSLSSLPAFEDPESMYDLYINPSLTSIKGEITRRCLHDIVKYKVPLGLSKEKYFESMRAKFLEQPFIRDFIENLKTERSMRFGAVTDWIYNHCTDVPLPYRWEIKSNVAILYRWLNYFVNEISWDVPGQHSQVIYWNKQK